MRGDEASHKASKEDFDRQLKSKSFISEDILDIIRKNENTNLSDNNIQKQKKKGITGNMISKAIED